MRITFETKDRPTRIAKAILKSLNAHGVDARLSSVREATAVMYGYAGWNDLLGQLGRAPQSPGDGDVDAETASARGRTFAERLAGSLAIAPALAASVIERVGPAAGGRRRGVTDEQWIDRLARIISNDSTFEALAESPDGIGFRVVGCVFRVDREGRITAGDLGALTIFSERVSVSIGGVPHPIVVETLSRLSPFGIKLLRTAPGAAGDGYEIARRLDPDSAFVALAERLPMMWGEVGNAGFYAQNGDPELSRACMAVVESDDPMGAYVSRIADYAASDWPHLPFDREAVRRTVEHVASFDVLVDFDGLQPWQIAVLAFAPSYCLPTAENVAAALGFAEGSPYFFKRHGMEWEPSVFFADFDGRWADHRKELDFGKRACSMGINGLFDTAAVMLIRSIAQERGDDVGEGYEISDQPVASFVARRLRRQFLAKKSLLSMMDVMREWRRLEPPLTGDRLMAMEEEPPIDTAGILASLYAVGVVTSTDACEALEAAGFNPDEVLDAVLEDCSFVDREVARRILIDDLHPFEFEDAIVSEADEDPEEPGESAAP